MKKNYYNLQNILNFRTLLVLTLIFISTNDVFSQYTATFSSSTTWTCPPNVSSVQVTAYGGGGGGGRGGTSNKNGGGGGGGGAYTENLAVPVTPGTTYTITIGAAGSAGTNAVPNGGNGGLTTATFDSSITVSANGGFGGFGYINSATGGAGGSGGTRNGGTGGTGATSGSGGGGGCAGTTSNGGNGGAGGTTTAGSAGGGNAGAGGAAKTNNSAAGNAGSNYGGGGGGGTNANNGGAGAGGYMTITYTISNDACAGAITLTSNTSCVNINGSTAGATDNNEVGDCVTGTENSVWFQFQAVATTHVVTVKGVTGFDPVLNVISNCGSATAPTGASCVDSTGDAGTETLTLTGLTIGSFYKIQVHDYWGVLMANGFTICVTHTPPPTITSLGSSSGCVGSSITINGTNLTGATAANVKIGGTAVTSITSNNGSTIVAVIGSGTTGTVTVTTAGGTATSAGSFTVNPLPAAISGAATVCTGVTTTYTDTTAGGTWSVTNGTGSATISATGDVTGVTAGTITVVYTLPTTCSISKSVTVQQTPGAIAGGSSTVCSGAATPAFTNPNSGGTWSVTNGTGTASITSGGVLTGGNAGSVTVNYTIGSCTPATFPVTVNALPANPGNPTSNSPQCNPPGVTLTAAATAPGTENYYWQTTSLGTSTANNASASFLVTSSATYYIRAQTISTGCWSAGQGSLAVVVDNGISSLATSPSPGNAATGVCYSGSGPITSISWTAAIGASSYDVYFGAGSLPGSVTSNVTTTSYNTGALLASTTYYWKIVPRNACGISSGSPITWTFTTDSTPCSCTPTGNLDCTLSDYISNVTLNTLNNTTTCGSGGYTVYPASGSQTTTMTTGQSYTFSLSVGSGSGTHGAAVWIDFNQNGVFTDAGEYFLVSNAITPSTTTSITITIPAGATIGQVKMRVRYAYNVTVSSSMSCTMSGTYGETEDYTITLISPATCATPTAQPTSLVLSSITSTSINGSFTAASPAPSGYLIVRSTSATAPTPVNGTTYAVGSTAFGAGTLVIQGSAVTSTGVTFSDSSLVSNTQYYYYIFSYNNACIGAPYYFTVSPLSNNATTCVGAISSAPVNSAITGTSCTITWGASPVGGGAATITYTLEVYTDSGYSSPITGSPFSTTSNSYGLTGLNGGTIYYYRVKASNGSCSTAYSTNSVTTSLTNDNCSGATSLTVNPNSACITSTTGTSSGATQSQAGCTGNADDDVWFKFVATGSSHIITISPITLNNAVFEVFSGNCAGLSSIICVNNTTGSNAETTTLTGLTAGNTYFVRVYSNGNAGNAGTFTICVTTPIPPSNNQCANATNLPCGTSNLAGTTVLTNSYTHGTGCIMSNYGVWYTFAGDGNSSTISVTTTNYDVEMSISSGSCGSFTNIACQDSALSSGTETYTFTTAVGVNYYVYVAYYYSGGTSTDTGTFTISRSCVVPYNPCTSITNIAACGSSNTTTIAAGAGGYSPSACGWTTSGVEKIYTFTPASTGNFTITQSSSFTYIDYQFKPVSSGCSSTGWTCIDAMSGAVTSSSFTLTAGVQYYILLDPESSSGGNVTFTINCPTPPLTNDEPCGAISLTVTTTCSYSTYTNSGAAASGGVTDPGCGGYSGGDVWFSAVVPATGELDVDLQSGVMTDSGMAFYSGTCGNLTLLECDDDDSNNGAMSYISMNGLTPGQTIYIRVWEYGNNNNGTFGICATTPSCPSPSDLYSNILSTTSVTVGWNASTPPAAGGYQYYINTTGTAPTAGTTPTGSTAAGVTTVTLTGLTAGVKYYFWIRSFCGGSDVSTWFGPTNYTPCAVGNGTGTTTNSCPSITAGGQGLGDVNPAALTCSALTCVNLEATYVQLNQPTDYTVTSIPYSPPYQYTCLQNPVSVNVDDVWSSVINLPFNFCFYGNNYNKCLIGSNGVITFDTTNNTPGGYSGWSFNSDLPNVSLFKNTIFGVYHDIDPSKGGQVGWELITLNTGCRALVASWNDIPMYSSTCNSQLYTGMIVLYENTSVIEVYIKEKNICPTWNNGNAIVGIQNSTGTSAVVAPNRNGLSTNWAVTNEAWRFVPSGPSLTSIQWYEGTVATGTPIPGGTTDVINVCPTVTTTYTAEVTYALCNGNLKYSDTSVVTVNGNKIWNGVTSTDWNTGTNWTPNGVPTSANCVVVPVVASGRYPLISAAPDAVGYNLSVYNNASLTVGANQNLTITDKITVKTPSTGSFTVNNNANLIQINDSAINTGPIFYKRIAPSIKGSDYVYWSSPVVGQDMGTIYDTGTQGYRYQWNPILNNGNGAGGNVSQGLWEAANGTMTTARGYIIRGSSSFGMPATNIATTFTGVPVNGIVPYTVQRGNYTGAPYNGANGVQITNLNDNYNLLGNPYPSSMNALKFLQVNAYDTTTNPTGQILGNVKLWLHGIDPTYGAANPFYGSYLYNYSANDYLTLNYLGSTTPSVADIIRSGQAFFVQMIDGAAGSGTVNFNNSMRYDGSILPYSNGNFFKSGNIANNSEFSFDRHRIWLDLVDATSQSSRILLGYATNATNNYDTLFDAPTGLSTGMKLFSMIENENEVYDIQGRSLPFNINDEIPIGIKAPTQGNYTFAIAAVDGLFDNQNIYLKDNLLNITHDLKANPYHFTTISGTIKDRFKIVYIDNALGTIDYSSENNIKVMTNEQVVVSSNHLQMESIQVYNVLGQELATYKDIDTNYFILSNLHKNNTTLLLKIKLQTGETVIKKIIY